MKTISTLLMTLMVLALTGTANAGTTYTVSSNKNWSTFSIPSTCANCTITINTGATLTVDEDVTCQQCTINGGGNMVMTNHTFGIQFITATTYTTFSNITFTMIGSGGLTGNAPISLTNSTFYLDSNTASPSVSPSMTTSYETDLINSKVVLNANSTWQSTGGGIDLSSGSTIQIGDGTPKSTAMLFMNGPALNIYDTSSVTLGNYNNNYENWGNYTTAPSAAGPTTSHSTANSSSINCGSSPLHSCSSPNQYGPATMSSAGTKQGATLLPVSLVDYTAMLNNDNQVELKWETLMESNSSHFNIERSQDGLAWSVIGTIEAQGNSSTTKAYQFTDENPVAGNNYYRLTLVDRDGNYGYSEVKMVRTTTLETTATVSVYPNPARQYVNVTLNEVSEETVMVRMYSLSGQVLDEKQVAAGNGSTVTFPVEQYANGIYVMTVIGTNGTHQSTKIMINR